MTGKIKTQDFIFEIGTEELPPKDLEKLSISLGKNFASNLTKASLKFGSIRNFSTPRRLAVLITDLQQAQEEQVIERKGPSVEYAFDKNGKPTKAALGFADSCGTDIENIETLDTPKGKFLYKKITLPGKNTIDLLPEIILSSIQALPISKKMYWGNNIGEFVRPVHSVLALYGSKIVPVSIFNIDSSDKVFGHRFLSNKAIKIKSAKEYEQKLKENYVIPYFNERKKLIQSELIKEAKKINYNAVITEWLLQEVTGLVEFPVVLSGSFNKKLLDLPEEVLISAMEDHQRCFALKDASNQLVNSFLLVSNLKSKSPNIIVEGNEKVIDARLKDAYFYYIEDQKQDLNYYAKKLNNIIFQKNLGTLAEKITRISSIAKFLAKKINTNERDVEEGAKIAKADLNTQMVYEFPELQGVTGYYYAINSGFKPEIAVAVKDHYLPKSTSDKLPQNNIGICLSIADKVDSLVGFFGINKIPTGEKDPFALRRQALGIIRIIIEKKLDLDLIEIINIAINSYNNINFANKNLVEDLVKFFLERMKNWYHSMGINPDFFTAALNKNNTNLLELSRKITAIKNFSTLTEAENLSQANKRVKNILTKNQDKIVNLQKVVPELLIENAEKNLYHTLQKITQENAKNLADKNYTEILNVLSKLEPHLEAFFTDVMVMCKDEKIMLNRFSLLQEIRNNFLIVGDISVLSK